ncbi:MAG: 5'/3'-nucleotidase SurE [Candidatus Zixiibacteriota bacterium]|nr:MAG: 5'/3'-nucleotidase SurE [candidate division Zixibacteria bacterium]
MLILLSNDDGYQAEGIKALARELKKIGRVVIVAPMWEQSGTSHSLTIYRPLRTKKISNDVYAVSGTPTDAVMIAVYCILNKKPDILVSGINHGQNMGDDVTYSGTVAAAMEGTILGIPSIAISQITSNDIGVSTGRIFDKAARFATRLVRSVKKNGIPKGTLLNVNVPEYKKADARRYRITRLGERVYHDVITEKIDPRGEPYFWIGGHYTVIDKGPDTDYGAIQKNFISVTPLDIDLTDRKFYGILKDWKI